MQVPLLIQVDAGKMVAVYASIIRPHLEYASATWDPHLACDIALLENVQKFVLRICLREWRMGYFDLSVLRSFFKLCLLKLVHKLTPCPFDTPRRALARAFSASSFPLCQPFAKTNAFMFSFSPSSVNLWNNLPSDVVQVDSFAVFKKCMRVFFL